MNRNNKKMDYKQMVEFLKTPKGKAVLFFGFYFVFFFVLAVMARINPVTSSNDYKEDNNFDFSLSQISGNNYHFKYDINIDDKSYLYEGDRNGSSELFTLNSENYYRNGDNFLKNTNNIWLKADNPYIMKEFIDVDSITDILKISSLISKTDYESGMRTYDYNISTTSLVKLIDKQDIDLDDAVNSIFIKAEDEKQVNEISFSLDSYCKYKGIGDSCKVLLKYSNFNEVEDIKNPS